MYAGTAQREYNVYAGAAQREYICMYSGAAEGNTYACIPIFVRGDACCIPRSAFRVFWIRRGGIQYVYSATAVVEYTFVYSGSAVVEYTFVYFVNVLCKATN